MIILKFKIAASWLLLAVFCDHSIAIQEPVQQDTSIPTQVSDVIIIKNGGEFTGELLSRDYVEPESGKKMLAVRTPSGGEILLETTVASPKFKDPLVLSEYKNRLAAMKDSPEAHADMVAWLKTAGSARFQNQIEFHMKRICELDPNDDRTRRLLGQKKVNGHWIDEEALNAAHGYVPKGSTWQSTLESTINEFESNQKQLQDSAKIEWNRFKLQLSNTAPANVAAKLNSMMTPAMALLLIDEAKQMLRDESQGKANSLAARRTLIEAIATQRGQDVSNALIYFAIGDNDPGIRDLALTLLEQPGFDKTMIASKASESLTFDDNWIINRTAVLLGQLGDPVAVLPLIKSIVTEHTVATGSDPGRMNFQMGNGPGNRGSGGMQIDNTPKTKRVQVLNQDVLSALRRITGQNLGDSPGAWLDWYTRAYTIAGADIRRDR